MRPTTTSPRTGGVAAAATLLALLLLGACGPTDPSASDASIVPSTGEPADPGANPALTVPPPNVIPAADDPVDPDVDLAAAQLAGSGATPRAPEIDRLVMSADLRQGWLLVDALGFEPASTSEMLERGLAGLTGQAVPPGEDPWVFYSELLAAWDVPAPPGYLDHKRTLFVGHDPTWRPILDPEGPTGELDWRMVTWGGIEPEGRTTLTEPELVGPDAQGGWISGVDWLPDDDTVFGVVVDGAARAYPRRVLEVHGVVNDVLGGQPIVVGYCAPCGAATAFRRDLDAAGAPLGAEGAAPQLDGSGLLLRGDPLLYQPDSGSLVEQFRGDAVAGPWSAEEVHLAPLTVRTATWAAWRAAFPASTVISDDAGIGRVYVDDPLVEGPSAPTFPVGPVDPTLRDDEVVLGVVTPDGRSLAFAAAAVDEALAAGRPVEQDDVVVVRDAGGLVAVSADDATVLVSHEARWWAWAAFRAGTGLWTG